MMRIDTEPLAYLVDTFLACEFISAMSWKNQSSGFLTWSDTNLGNPEDQFSQNEAHIKCNDVIQNLA